jgi:hypothetical protein
VKPRPPEPAPKPPPSPAVLELARAIGRLAAAEQVRLASKAPAQR